MWSRLHERRKGRLRIPAALPGRWNVSECQKTTAMIPLRDSNPTRTFPIVTVVLIAANVLAFIVDRATASIQVVDVLTPYGIVRTHRLIGGLAQNYSLIPAELVSDPVTQWLTIFTSMFLHANWLHIAGNMLYLWIFGNNVEDTLGHIGFLLFYLVCGAIAAFSHIATGPGSEIPTVGASGAVAGVMGAYVVFFPHARVLALVPVVFFSTLMEVPALIVIGFWALIQFLNVSWLGGGELRGGGVAYAAHVGGFAAGLIIVLMLGGQRLVWRAARRSGRYSDWYD